MRQRIANGAAWRLGESRGIDTIFSRGGFVDKEIYVPLQPRT